VKAVAGIFLTAMATASVPTGAPPGVPQPVTTFPDVGAAVVQIVTISGRTGVRTRHGSAFYVDASGHLLTCLHVVDHMPKEDAPRLRPRDGREERFEVVGVDRDTDLALLRSDPPERFLVLGDAPVPRVGQRGLLGTTLRRCAIANVGSRRVPGTRRSILGVRLDRLADPGDSGGPLLDEETLVVIGVLRANLERATGGMAGEERRGYGLAIPLKYVEPFVRKYLNLPASGCVSGDDRQEAEVCARHGWPGSGSFFFPLFPPGARSGPGSTR
jgi:putative serine protease PepD